jgi:hypothetical protein
MIPPQPIIEDEEKELGALEILEKNLQQIIQVADQGWSMTPFKCAHAVSFSGAGSLPVCPYCSIGSS